MALTELDRLRSRLAIMTAERDAAVERLRSVQLQFMDEQSAARRAFAERDATRTSLALAEQDADRLYDLLLGMAERVSMGRAMQFYDRAVVEALRSRSVQVRALLAHALARHDATADGAWALAAREVVSEEE